MPDVPRSVPDVVVASDAPFVHDEVASVLSARRYAVRHVFSGPAVLAACRERLPDLVVCDLQMGNMGGVATCLELRLDESGGRLGHVPVLLLLDRRADVFLARRALADGYLVKPLDPIRLRRAVQALLAGDDFSDGSFRPWDAGTGAIYTSPSAANPGAQGTIGATGK